MTMNQRKRPCPERESHNVSRPKRQHVVEEEMALELTSLPIDGVRPDRRRPNFILYDREKYISCICRYRLGRPSKEYAPWYEPDVKTAWVAKRVRTLLEQQGRVCRVSFADAAKKLSEIERNDEAYISSDSSVVEKYLVDHGKLILQIFADCANKFVHKCPFITGLASVMKEKEHTKRLQKQKAKRSLNPRARMTQAVEATTTRLINRIWSNFYSHYSPEDSLQAAGLENEDDDTVHCKIGGSSGSMEMRWDGEAVGETSAGESLYRQAVIGGEVVAVGGAVILEVDVPAIYFVEYMFETSDHEKMLHGRLLQRGCQTVLQNVANERELFLTNKCLTVELKEVRGAVSLEIRSRPWGHQYRKENNTLDKLDRERGEKRKAKGLPIEYYCKSLYLPERGGFFTLPVSDIGHGTGFCSSCKTREDEVERSKIKLNVTKTGFFYNGIEYSCGDYVYVSPDCIVNINGMEKNRVKFKSGRNIGLKSFIVCQFLEVKVYAESTFLVRVRRFYRPEDISTEKAYTSDIRELYYSEDMDAVPPRALHGKCEIRKKSYMSVDSEIPISEHIFFCEHIYDSSTGSLKKLPATIKLKYSTTLSRKRKAKSIESETGSEVVKRLATLDIFAGCGGLSQGLEKAGVSETKWAIEYEEPAAQAFSKNHPESTVFVNNCNVILRAIMEKCGDIDDCVSTAEATELAAELDEYQKSILPLPGQVEFINGGPPCQGFSGLNRYSNNPWSKVQCEMILAFLSYADYFRPRYFLLENVRTFLSFNKGQTFRLTLASLLEMGYQVRFGVLEAGAYGVSQSRKRAFIWAAAPDEVLPEWPEPMHVFGGPALKVSLSRGLRHTAVHSTASGAPFRSITVSDTIGDLPPVQNGDSNQNKKYEGEPVSWFQKAIRGNMVGLNDHICKNMNELNLIRCKRIPKRPGADWRDLPKEKVHLSNGKVKDLIPQSLLKTGKRHNQWKGIYGRLDWEGNFPTSITDPQPMGKVGMCFHPDQDRIVTVRECARSQGFPDSFEFWGKIKHKHKQIGNAVPPPLAYALGRKLKEAVDQKRRSVQTERKKNKIASYGMVCIGTPPVEAQVKQ